MLKMIQFAQFYSIVLKKNIMKIITENINQ